MSLDTLALLEPVVKPDGEDAVDPRESEAFASLNQEIEKLSSLSGAGQPDWAKVEQLGCDFLNRSKDFLVTSWLCEAWTQRHAMMGVGAGLSLMAGLTDKYWDTAVPPVHRLRGRRNAIMWWIDRLMPWLETNTDVSIGSELAERMVSATRQFDALLSEKDPEAPSLSRLLGLLQRIPVDAETTKPSEAAAAAPAETPAVSSQGIASSDSPSPSSSVSSSSSFAAPATVSVQSPPQVSIPQPSAATRSGPVEIKSNDDLIALLRPIQDQVAQIGPALLQFDHAHPLSIQLSRFAARVGILEMPMATAGQTAIAPPPVAILDAYEKVTASKNPQAMVEFCEARIRTFPFWLDLDLHSARGYAMMGTAGSKMRDAITEALLIFLTRLPGIESYSFSNGMPFANAETQGWIRQCREEKAGDIPTDSFSLAQTRASSLQTDGDPDAAMSVWQDYIASSHSQRDRFRARLAWAEMVLLAYPDTDSLVLLEPLAEECLRMQLTQWEPDLASRVWILHYQAARKTWLNPPPDQAASRREEARRQMDIALKQLSISDMAAAVKLSH